MLLPVYTCTNGLFSTHFAEDLVILLVLMPHMMMTSISTKPRAVNVVNTATAITTLVTVELAGEEVVGGTETVTILVEVESKGECSPAEDATEGTNELVKDTIGSVGGTEIAIILVESKKVCIPAEDGTSELGLEKDIVECVGGTEIAVVSLAEGVCSPADDETEGANDLGLGIGTLEV